MPDFEPVDPVVVKETGVCHEQLNFRPAVIGSDEGNKDVLQAKCKICLNIYVKSIPLEEIPAPVPEPIIINLDEV